MGGGSPDEISICADRLCLLGHWAGMGGFYSANVALPGGVGSLEIPFALNDSPGEWKLTARDAATGVTGEAPIVVHLQVAASLTPFARFLPSSRQVVTIQVVQRRLPLN
jgi:hypothetical protein